MMLFRDKTEHTRKLLETLIFDIGVNAKTAVFWTRLDCFFQQKDHLTKKDLKEIELDVHNYMVDNELENKSYESNDFGVWLSREILKRKKLILFKINYFGFYGKREYDAANKEIKTRSLIALSRVKNKKEEKK
jgi:hypothetical protein